MMRKKDLIDLICLAVFIAGVIFGANMIGLI
mgnify:CR=1 FL=1|jgi:hypothetical protein